jgi:hypothetical protein
MSNYYILDGHETRPANIVAWACWYETAERHVAETQIADSMVSTVFLGLDHSFGTGPPLLFETMVFGGAMDQETDRYTTWEQAEAGHAAMCGRVKAQIAAEDGPGDAYEEAKIMEKEQHDDRRDDKAEHGSWSDWRNVTDRRTDGK